MLATEPYVTCIPGSVLRLAAEQSALKVLPVELPRWWLPVAIITLNNRTLSPIAELFIRAAREVVKPLA